MTHSNSRFGVDGNGVLTEVRIVDGHEICIHHDDIPDSDVTEIHGVPVTTAIRTVIDIAPDISRSDLELVVAAGLARNLFTVEEAFARIAQPDMVTRCGAHLLRAVLEP